MFHVAPHPLQFFSEVVDVVIGLLDAGVDEVDQIVNLVDFEPVERGIARPFFGESLGVDMVRLALEHLVLL